MMTFGSAERKGVVPAALYELQDLRVLIHIDIEAI